MKPTPANFVSASRGFGWSFLASILVLLASLVAQFVLGTILPRHDFGVYAIAISFSNMLMVFRDGGVTHWLARMPASEFDRSAGKAMCLAYVSSILVALAVFGSSFVVGWVYQQDEVARVMQVMAWAFPINAYSIVAMARLQVDLRFQAMASVKFVSGMIRYFLIVLFAHLGFGAMCFAWPLLIVAVFELLACFVLTRLPLRLSEFSLESVRQIFGESKWSLSGSFASAIMRQCDYAVLGLFVTTDVLGAYYFAFQLAMQPVILFGESLRRVILPIFSRLKDDSERERRGLRYAGTFIALIATPLLLLLAVNAHPLIELLWGETKWAASVIPLQLLALVMPLHLLSVFSEALTQSRGKFRLWTVAVLLRGLGLGLAAFFAALVAGNADIATIAMMIAIYLASSAAAEVMVLFRTLGLPIRVLADVFVLPFVISTSVAVAAIVVQRWFPIDSPLLAMVGLTGTFSALVLAAFYGLCRDSISELAMMLRRSQPGRARR